MSHRKQFFCLINYLLADIFFYKTKVVIHFFTNPLKIKSLKLDLKKKKKKKIEHVRERLNIKKTDRR